MNLGAGGCSEPRSHHCTPAWAARAKTLSEKKKKKKERKKEKKKDGNKRHYRLLDRGGREMKG